MKMLYTLKYASNPGGGNGCIQKIGKRYDPNSFCILKYYEPGPPKVQIISSFDLYFFLYTLAKLRDLEICLQRKVKDFLCKQISRSPQLRKGAEEKV